MSASIVTVRPAGLKWATVFSVAGPAHRPHTTPLPGPFRQGSLDIALNRKALPFSHLSTLSSLSPSAGNYRAPAVPLVRLDGRWHLKSGRDYTMAWWSFTQLQPRPVGSFALPHPAGSPGQRDLTLPGWHRFRPQFHCWLLGFNRSVSAHQDPPHPGHPGAGWRQYPVRDHLELFGTTFWISMNSIFFPAEMFLRLWTRCLKLTGKLTRNLVILLPQGQLQGFSFRHPGLSPPFGFIC